MNLSTTELRELRIRILRGEILHRDTVQQLIDELEASLANDVGLEAKLKALGYDVEKIR